MRMLLAGLMVFGFCAPCAFAEDSTPRVEIVDVDASMLDGVWRIYLPAYVYKTSFFGDLKWGPMTGYLCRVGRTETGIATQCVSGSGEGSQVSLKNGRLHVALGSMLVRIDVDGVMQSDTSFDETFGIKLLGIAFVDPDHAMATKLKLSADAPDDGGKSALLTHLLAEMDAGKPTEHFDLKARNDKLLTQDDLTPLGAMRSVFFVGQFTPPQGDPAAKTSEAPLSVYNVEFENGVRLCGLRQLPDGTIDRFSCV